MMDPDNIVIGYDATRKIRQCEKCTVILVLEHRSKLITIDKDLDCSEIHSWVTSAQKRPYNCFHRKSVSSSLKICEKMFPRWFELYKIFFVIASYEASKDIYSHVLTFYLLTLTT